MKGRVRSKLKRFWENKILAHCVNGADSANLGVIFLLAIGHALSGIGQYFVFPIALGTNAIKSVLAIHHAYEERKKTKAHLAISDAIATFATALGIFAAIILTFVGQSALTAIAPAVLTGTIGLNALYDLGAGSYCWYRYAKLKKEHPQKAEKYFQKAKEYTIGFTVSALATIGAGTALIADKASFAALGAVAGAIGAGYAVYEGYHAYKEDRILSQHRQEKNELESVEDKPTLLEPVFTNNATIHAALSYNNAKVVHRSTPCILQQLNESQTSFTLDIANPHTEQINCLRYRP